MARILYLDSENQDVARKTLRAFGDHGHLVTMIASIYQAPTVSQSFVFDLAVIVDDLFDFELESLKVFHAARCLAKKLPHMLVVCPINTPAPRLWKINSLRLETREPTSYVIAGDGETCPIYQHLGTILPSVPPRYTLWTEPVSI